MISLLRHLDDESFTQILTSCENEMTPCYEGEVNGPANAFPSPETFGSLTNEHLYPITSRNWKAILSWTAFHPEQVSSLRDNHGQTALHHACLFKAPAYVVEAIIYASPECAMVCNNDGELPIHWAVRVQAPFEILRLLLEAAPRCGLVNDLEGETALSLLWDRHGSTLLDMVREGDDGDGGSGGGGSVVNFVDLFESSRRGTGWRMIMLLLRHYYYGTVPHLGTNNQSTIIFQPLHAAVGSPIPLPLFQFICSVLPHEIMERDDHGRLPLAVAASSPQSSRAVIDILLALYPEGAAIHDGEGRYPLAIALECGKVWDDGVATLFQANPQVLGTRDSRTGLYPFMLPSATDYHIQHTDPKHSLDTLDTTFRLLLADPECVRTHKID